MLLAHFASFGLNGWMMESQYDVSLRSYIIFSSAILFNCAYCQADFPGQKFSSAQFVSGAVLRFHQAAVQIPPEPSRLCCFSFIARNRGHFASVINCQRHLFFKMADKNNRSQGKRFPYDILNNLGSLDLFYEVYIPWNKKHGYWVKFGVVKLFLFRVRPKWSFANKASITGLQMENWRK